jgi:hypothetical protein
MPIRKYKPEQIVTLFPASWGKAHSSVCPYRRREGAATNERREILVIDVQSPYGTFAIPALHSRLSDK